MSEKNNVTYPEILKDLMGRKSYHLSKANALSEVGMRETAQPLFLSAAVYEEQIAILLDTEERELEAAIHRISAASCYKAAGSLNNAVNLFRAALSGPLQEKNRNKTRKLLNECLQELARDPLRVIKTHPFLATAYAGSGD